MNVSVIIVNYNTRELTHQCIESVKAQTKDVFCEIILVDNASTDGSKDCFERREDIIYLYSIENVGFGRANNLGFSKASGKYLFLLNSDTILNNNAIRLFYDFMEAAPTDIACCGSFLRDRDLKIIHSYGRHHTGRNLIYEWCLYPDLSRLGVKLEKYDYPINKTENYYVVDYVTGADLFIRKEIAERCGLFDPDFFMYYEDAELCKRYHNAGYKSVLIEAPQIIHMSGSSFQGNILAKSEIFIRNMFIYTRKSMNPMKYRFFRCLFKGLYCLCFMMKKIPLKIKYQHISSIIKL